MKKKAKIKFDDYVKMVYKAAWYYSRRFNIDFDELKSQGFEIFCIAKRDFDPSRALFSTYLHRNLYGRLNDYCKCAIKDNDHEIIDEELTFEVASSINPIGINLLRNYAEKILTKEGYEMFNWVVSRDWEHKKCKKPDQLDARIEFCGIKKWSVEQFFEVWTEIRYFWTGQLFEFVNSGVLS